MTAIISPAGQWHRERITIYQAHPPTPRHFPVVVQEHLPDKHLPRTLLYAILSKERWIVKTGEQTILSLILRRSVVRWSDMWKWICPLTPLTNLLYTTWQIASGLKAAPIKSITWPMAIVMSGTSLPISPITAESLLPAQVLTDFCGTLRTKRCPSSIRTSLFIVQATKPKTRVQQVMMSSHTQAAQSAKPSNFVWKYVIWICGTASVCRSQ